MYSRSRHNRAVQWLTCTWVQSMPRAGKVMRRPDMWQTSDIFIISSCKPDIILRWLRLLFTVKSIKRGHKINQCRLTRERHFLMLTAWTIKPAWTLFNINNIVIERLALVCLTQDTTVYTVFTFTRSLTQTRYYEYTVLASYKILLCTRSLTQTRYYEYIVLCTRSLPSTRSLVKSHQEKIDNLSHKLRKYNANNN